MGHYLHSHLWLVGLRSCCPVLDIAVVVVGVVVLVVFLLFLANIITSHLILCPMDGFLDAHRGFDENEDW